MKFISDEIKFNTKNGTVEFSYLDRTYTCDVIYDNVIEGNCFNLPNFFYPEKGSIFTLEDAIRMLRYGDGDEIVKVSENDEYMVQFYFDRHLAKKVRVNNLKKYANIKLKDYYVYMCYGDKEYYACTDKNHIGYFFSCRRDITTLLIFHSSKEAFKWIDERKHVHYKKIDTMFDSFNTFKLGIIPVFPIDEFLIDFNFSVDKMNVVSRELLEE